MCSDLGPVHTSPFLLLFVFAVSELSVHTLSFLYQNKEKYLRVCLFISRQNAFLCVHISRFCELLSYRFQNIQFCVFTVFFSKKLYFCRYSLWDRFWKSLFLCCFSGFVSRWILLQKHGLFSPFSHKYGLVWTEP